MITSAPKWMPRPPRQPRGRNTALTKPQARTKPPKTSPKAISQAEKFDHWISAVAR